MTDIRADFRRYAQLIEPLIAQGRGGVSISPEPGSAVRVERAAVLAGAIGGTYTEEPSRLVEKLIDLGRSGQHVAAQFFDAAGHQRAVYRPVTIYAWLQSFRILYEALPLSEFGRWEEGTRAWADLLESDLGSTPWPEGGLVASAGDRLAEMAWDALALYVAGKVFVRDAWTDLASDTFGRLTRAQQPGGAFLAATPADQPETMWYHELQILHAAAGYAVQAEDRAVAAAVAKAAAFHLQETQPDHATSQPWALFPFIWNADARSLADQVLHAARLQQPVKPDGVSLMLLADCLYSLRLFL